MGRTFKPLEPLRGWRKLAVNTWRPPQDGRTYAFCDMPMQAALDYCQEVRARTDVRLTVTHLVVRGVALAFARFPQMNGIVARNRIMIRDTVDVFMQVAAEGGSELSGIKVTRADQKSAVEIAREVDERVALLRARRDRQVERTKSMLDRVPLWLLAPLMRTIAWLIYDRDLDLTRFGVVKDEFGSVMVSNTGVFGITRALAPIVPFSRTPMVVLMGAVEDRVVPENGRPVIRPMMTLGVTYDHRFMDGFHGGEMARITREYLENPAAFEAALPRPLAAAAGVTPNQ